MTLDPVPHILIATGTPPSTAEAIAESTDYLIHTTPPRCIVEVVPVDTPEAFYFDMQIHTWIDRQPDRATANRILAKSSHWHERLLEASAKVELPEGF